MGRTKDGSRPKDMYPETILRALLKPLAGSVNTGSWEVSSPQKLKGVSRDCSDNRELTHLLRGTPGRLGKTSPGTKVKKENMCAGRGSGGAPRMLSPPQGERGGPPHNNHGGFPNYFRLSISTKPFFVQPGRVYPAETRHVRDMSFGKAFLLAGAFIVYNYDGPV